MEEDELAKAFWITIIIRMPGAMKVVKSTPMTSPRRGPIARVKIATKSPAVTSGASSVCVQTATKRITSRSISVQSPSQFTRPKRRTPMACPAAGRAAPCVPVCTPVCVSVAIACLLSPRPARVAAL